MKTLIIGALAAAALVLAPFAAAAPYANCTEAKADGHANITSDDPAYWAAGDRDGDGVACES